MNISVFQLGLSIEVLTNGSLSFCQYGDNQDGHLLPQQYTVGEKIQVSSAQTGVIVETVIEMDDRRHPVTNERVAVHHRAYRVELAGHQHVTSEHTLLKLNPRPVFNLFKSFSPVIGVENDQFLSL